MVGEGGSRCCGDKSRRVQPGSVPRSSRLPADAAPSPSSLLEPSRWVGSRLKARVKTTCTLLLGLSAKEQSGCPKAGRVQQPELARGGWGGCPQPGSSRSMWYRADAFPCPCLGSCPRREVLQGPGWAAAPLPLPWGRIGLVGALGEVWQSGRGCADSLILLYPSACGAAGQLLQLLLVAPLAQAWWPLGLHLS